MAMVALHLQKFIVRFDDSFDMRDKVFRKLLTYCIKHDSFSKETQSEECLKELPELFSDLIENTIKFKVENNETN